MNIKRILSYILLVVLMVSCKPKINNDEIKTRYDQVMMVHDEVMPKMKPMSQLKKKLKKELINRANNAELSMKITESLSEIEAADEQMMDWMADFKLPEDKSEKAQISYLQKEQKKIEKVRMDIESAINNAHALTMKN